MLKGCGEEVRRDENYAAFHFNENIIQFYKIMFNEVRNIHVPYEVITLRPIHCLSQ